MMLVASDLTHYTTTPPAMCQQLHPSVPVQLLWGLFLISTGTISQRSCLLALVTGSSSQSMVWVTVIILEAPILLSSLFQFLFQLLLLSFYSLSSSFSSFLKYTIVFFVAAWFLIYLVNFILLGVAAVDLIKAGTPDILLLAFTRWKTDLLHQYFFIYLIFLITVFLVCHSMSLCWQVLLKGWHVACSITSRQQWHFRLYHRLKYNQSSAIFKVQSDSRSLSSCQILEGGQATAAWVTSPLHQVTPLRKTKLFCWCK